MSPANDLPDHRTAARRRRRTPGPRPARAAGLLTAAVAALGVAVALGVAAAVAVPVAAPAGAAARGGPDPSGPWRELEPGLELARFASSDTVHHDRGDLIVLRVDPHRWELRLDGVCADARRSPRSARGWCAELDLMAAVNAGMYQADRRSHVGFLRRDGRTVAGGVNDYLSAAAFQPLRPGLPPFRIFDLDETPLDQVVADYGTVVQNLRLVKRPRDSRWTRRDRRWREAALGEDSAGRALLIECRTPLTMADLVDRLLALPLDLVAAQHLEGGSEAQLHLAHPAVDPDLRAEGRWLSWPVPNVLGVARR
ncbi:MAG: phosphodiester glycosidase family protein [Candidatus Krumholzibacteriia bacterium]